MQYPYEQIIEYCNSKLPEEACGVIVVEGGKPVFLPCKNIAEEKLENFVIDPQDYAIIEDSYEDIVAIVHSHKRCATPSRVDIASQQQTGVPWLIIGKDNEIFWLKSKQEIKPLYGREYIWHVQDCLTFIQDWYKQEFNIGVMDHYRQENFWEQGQELYLENYEKAGFVEVPRETMRYGDVILFHLGSSITTHAGVYLGGNVFGHHLNKKLSSKDVYGQFYMDRTTMVVRHKDNINEDDQIIRSTR